MGRAICAAVHSDPELDLVAAVDPAIAGEAAEGVVVASTPEAIGRAGAEVAIDFTVSSAALSNASWCAENAVHAVIGTTGLHEEAFEQLAKMFSQGTANCIIAPNFAIGAVLMMRFAEMAAPWFETVEIIELHHDGKLDAPSGTATLTAQRLSTARRARPGGSPARGGGQAPAARGSETAPGVRVHSVRLRGLVAHQEVLLGTTGQILTIRHDSLDRSSFMPGVLLATKEVPHRAGFTVGIEALLGL